MNKMFLIEPSMEILPAKDDRIFKSLLTRDEPESKLVLMDLTIIFIELSKLKEILNKPVAVMTPPEMWSIFFEYVDNPNYRDIINELIRSKEEILMASTLLQSISQDDYEKARLLSRRKYGNDLESNFNTAVCIAKTEGKMEGKREAPLELAKNLLDILDIETIAKKTGLSVNQVKRLNAKTDSK